VIQLRWTDGAYNDLKHIADYVFENSPENAEKVIRAIYEAPSALLAFPSRGRTGKEPGTREFVIPALPYIVVYKLDPEIVHVVRILHGAQDRSGSS
jgi:toxin ParE1/3/4